jgi:hypothetical protein
MAIGRLYDYRRFRDKPNVRLAALAPPQAEPGRARSAPKRRRGGDMAARRRFSDSASCAFVLRLTVKSSG